MNASPSPANFASLGPIQREPVKLKLSDQERGFYSNMYAQVNPEGKRELESQAVVQFLMSSGLELPKLKQVWDVAARTSNNYLVREEFYVALRLVAYMQNDMPATENSITMNIVPPLPRFDDNKSVTPGGPPRGGMAP